MLPLPRGAVWLLLFLFCAALYINGVQADGRVVCYYTNWSVYRPGTAKFNPQNINPYLCTHLIYAFGGFTKDNQMKPFDKYQDIEQGGYAKFTGLKTYNKQLKTMIAIGGWNEASSRFSPLVANPERRQKFIKNILKFLRQNHFDGIDLDWEYPAHREGGKPRDRENYAQFVQELRAEFERESEKTGRPRLLLTMAVPAGIEYIEKGYDIPKLNKYLDWFNVLSYDFHSSHEPSVNHHAPLYSLEEESEYNYDAELNIDYSVKFYLNAGADRDKLVLGIPTYGRSYTLINEESTEIGAPAEAPGEQGDATREKGYLAYYEICQNIKEDPEWTVVQPNPNAMGPYAYRRNQWVGYDDEAIVRKKAQYVVENGLGGIMFWAIDNDDFRGTCTGKPYPLIEAAKEAMLDSLGLGINEVSKPSAPQKPSRSRSRENSSSTRNRITTTEHKLTYAERKGGAKRTQVTQQTTRKQQSTTTAAPTTIKLTEAEGSSLYIGGRTTTPPPPTTPDPGTDFKCEEEGFFQHPRDCKKYYWCLDSGPSGLGIVAHQFTCPSGLYFNPAADSCDFARNVPCKTKKSTTAAPITSTTTTTARPTSSYNRITAATSRPTTFFRTTPRTTTTTTTTEAPEEEEYEDEDNLPSPFAKNKSHHDKDSEEDPKVIKELIELIRKVGGVEELEKHLLRKDDGTISIKESSSSSSTSQTATTPSSISKSLYEKVLSKPNALNSFRNRFTSTSSFRTTKTQIKTQDHSETDSEESQEGDSKSSGATAGFSKYSSVLRSNSRQGPQSEGIDKLSEFDGFQKEKKQYTTINRNRGTKKTDEVEEEEEDEVASKLSTVRHNEETEEEVEKSSVKSTRRPLSASTPAYSTIRRTRPSTTTETTQEDEEEQQEEKEVTERKTYSSLNRSRVRGTTTTELPDVTEVTAGSSRYKYLERTRPTRPSTESSNKVNDEEDDEDIESENQENTVHFKAVKNIENTRETQQQQEITKNTQRTYASIGRRTTISTTATPETETTTSAAKTTTTATPTTSTTETPLTTTTPLTILDTTTPESISLTTNIPITTTTNPITTTSSTTITKTTTTSLSNDEDVLENLATTTSNPNQLSSDISETLSKSQNINSLLTESSSSLNSTPLPTTESGLDTNDSQLTTTTETTSTSTAINDSDNLTKTEDTENEEEVNLVSKQKNKTLYSTRTRITTTTTPPTTTTTTTNSDIETTTNAKKTLGVRRQQILLNRSSQKTVSTSTDTTPTTTATESVINDFLGTVSSPRPFGFPKRRTRPTSEANTEEVVKTNDETLVTRQKTTTTTTATKLNAAANTKIKVSSQNTILSQTGSNDEVETSSQQEHVQEQKESEVTNQTEHLNSKDTKVEHLKKHVVEQVDGIEGNTDIKYNSLKHDINNNNVDSSNYNNNNNSAPRIRTHTVVHEVDDDDEDPKKLFTWRDARQPTKPTPKKKKLIVTEVTTEERVRQKVSPDHVTIVNVVESDEKDSKFSKKESDLVRETGKYRGKSLEESSENVEHEENHVDGEEEGRAFKTYTTINRRRQQTQQTTGIGEDESAVNGLRTTQVIKSGEEENKEGLSKTNVKYQTITRGQTSKTVSKEDESVNNNEDNLNTKFKYTTITRSSTTKTSSGSEESNADDDTKENNTQRTKSTFKYSQITRGQSSHSTDSEDESEDGSVANKHKYSNVNRAHESDGNSADNTQTKTTYQYTKITRGQSDHDGQDSSTESGNEKKTYTTISRTRGSGSTTENIPYKAIVRDNQGIRLTEDELSGFVKNAGDLAAIEAAKRTYLTISRGGQIVSSENNNELEDEHSKIDSMESLSLTQIEKSTEDEEEHKDIKAQDEKEISTGTFKYQTITRGQVTKSVTDETETNSSSQGSEDVKTKYSTLNRKSTAEGEEKQKEDELKTHIDEEKTVDGNLKYQTITRGQVSKTVVEETDTSTFAHESEDKYKTKYTTLNRGSSKEENLKVEEESVATTTTERSTTTTTERTTTTSTTTTAEPTTSSAKAEILESSTEFVAAETTTTTTAEPTTRRSLFKNRGSTETNVQESEIGRGQITTDEKEVTATQTGRKKIVFKNRTTVKTLENQESSTDKSTEEISKSTQSQTTFRRRPINGGRPAVSEEIETETKEAKLKFDRGSLINKETDTVEGNLRTTTPPTLPRATYRPKDKGDLSSLLALDFAKKYGNNNQQQFGNGKRRRPVDRTKVTAETENDGFSRTRLTGSTSEEITTNSETINGNTRTTITKKRIFTSKTSGKGNTSQTSETLEQSEVKNQSALKGDTEVLDEGSLENLTKKQGSKYQFTLGSAAKKRLGADTEALDAGSLEQSLNTENLTTKQGSKYQFALGGAAKTRIGAEAIGKAEESEENNKTRITSANNLQISSGSQIVNGRRRTIVRKRIQTNRINANENAASSEKTQTSKDNEELTGNADATSLEKTQTSGINVESNSKTQFKHKNQNENGLSSNSETSSLSESLENAENLKTKLENSKTSSESTNGSDNQTNDNDDASNLNSKFNFKSKQSSFTTRTNTYSGLNRKNSASATTNASQNESTENENTSKSDSKFNLKSKQTTNTSTTKTNSYTTLNRKNTFANKRVTAGGNQSDKNKENQQSETETETVEEISEDELNAFNKKVNSGSNYQSRNTLNSQNSQSNSARTNLAGRRGSLNKPQKYEEVEILEDGSKRITTTYIESMVVDGKIKTIKRTKTKTIIKQAPEYIYETEDSTTTTTRRPIPRNRGSARFQSTDLSSLLALDLASKSLRREQSENGGSKSRKKLIRKPVIIKEEEHVEEIEEDLPLRPIRPSVVTESTQVTSRRTRPTKPLRTTTTTEAPQIVEEDKEEEQQVKKVVSTTRRNFAFKRPSSTTTKPPQVKESEEKIESTTRRSFAFKRPVGGVKTETTETSSEQVIANEVNTKRVISLKRPISSVKTLTTTEEITKTTITQNENVSGSLNRFKTKSSRSESGEEVNSTASAPLTTTTVKTETTTAKSETTTAESQKSNFKTTSEELDQESLDSLKSKLANAVQTELIDALETKNAIQSGQDLSLPIYHRRKYYQYYKDSPITFISPITIAPETSAETNVDIAKQIHDVFNVSNDHLQPEPESEEVIALKAMEQAQEINSELSHFLLKTPGSN